MRTNFNYFQAIKKSTTIDTEPINPFILYYKGKFLFNTSINIYMILVKMKRPLIINTTL